MILALLSSGYPFAASSLLSALASFVVTVASLPPVDSLVVPPFLDLTLIRRSAKSGTLGLVLLYC